MIVIAITTPKVIDEDVCIIKALLKKGIDDIRYLSMLKKYRHIKEVDKFLTQAPLKVVTSSHNPTLADKVRQETIKLLLKYHK